MLLLCIDIDPSLQRSAKRRLVGVAATDLVNPATPTTASGTVPRVLLCRTLMVRGLCVPREG